MNRTKIEWCDYTWNPVTGCLHNCSYCYARRIAHRFDGHLVEDDNDIHILDKPLKETDLYANLKGKKSTFNSPYPFGYEPTFHRYRLDEPIQRKKPAKIFVSSMGDLFGDWVPDEWINEVLKIVKQCPQHTFQFLTKNPKRYQKFEFPENCWLGISIDGLEPFITFQRAAYLHRYYGGKNNSPDCLRFVSIEPLLGPGIADVFNTGYFDWIIVGAQTGPGAVPPKPEWVQDIIDQCRDSEVPIFLKDNLNWPEPIREWPKTERSEK